MKDYLNMKNIKVTEAQLVRFEKIKDILNLKSNKTIFTKEVFEELLNEWEHNILNITIPEKEPESTLEALKRNKKEFAELIKRIEAET